MTYRALLALGLGLAMGTPAWAQTMPTTAPGGVVNFKDSTAVAALQRDLASDDFATRERAQGLVDRVPMEGRDALAKLAESMSDPEAQSRLKARVEALDDIRVTSVPGISLELKDATLGQVTAALAKATGQPFTCEVTGFNELYTLKAEGMGFWELQRQLNLQGSIWFNTGVNDIRVNRDKMEWRDASMTRGVAVFLPAIAGPRLGRAPGVPVDDTYTASLGLGIDPRICILQVKPPEFGVVTDDANIRWEVTAATAAVSTISLGRGITFTRPITLKPVLAAGASIGKKIPSLRGVFPIVVQSAMESQVIDPAKGGLGVPTVMGNLEITVTKCSVTESENGITVVAFDLNVKTAPGKGETPFPMGPVAVNLLDEAGKTAIVRTLPLGFVGSMSNAFSLPVAGPLTMRLDVTTAVREVKVPFEFKDVPVP